MKKLLLWSFILFLSCEQLEAPIGNEHLISLKEAESLAIKSATNSEVASARGRTIGEINISESKTYKDDDNLPLLHVVKFDGSRGFRIISADRQFPPLLAHSDSSTLVEGLPGVSHWFEFVLGYLKKERIILKTQPNEKKQSGIRAQWITFESTGFPFLKREFTQASGRTKILEPNPDQCAPGFHWRVDRLVNTSWGQGGAFNSFFPPSSCSTLCNRIPAGCGAIAMAQIMRLHQWPSGYNYGTMPGYHVSCGALSSGQIEAGRLVNDVANSVNSFSITVNIPFYCSVSTATLPWGIPQGFSQMGYSSGGNYGDFFSSYPTIFSNVLGGYPAIMSGRTSFLGLGSWHIWIIDGIDRYVTPDCQVYEWFRCNWGWNGSNNSDWYWYGNGSYNGYDTDLKTVTNIFP